MYWVEFATFCNSVFVFTIHCNKSYNFMQTKYRNNRCSSGQIKIATIKLHMISTWSSIQYDTLMPLLYNVSLHPTVPINNNKMHTWILFWCRQIDEKYQWNDYILAEAHRHKKCIELEMNKNINCFIYVEVGSIEKHLHKSTHRRTEYHWIISDIFRCLMHNIYKDLIIWRAPCT